MPAFTEVMEEIKKEDHTAHDWLINQGPRHWSRAHFRTTPESDILVNNLCESFNGTNSILLARGKPILSMLERIRMYLLKRLTKQLLAVEKWSNGIGPRVSKILEESKKESGIHQAFWAGGLNYQVTGLHVGMNAVDLGRRTCTCKKWDLSGIPCPHVVACAWARDEDPVIYVSDCYKK